MFNPALLAVWACGCKLFEPILHLSGEAWLTSAFWVTHASSRHFVSAVEFACSTWGSASEFKEPCVRQEKSRAKPHLKTRITTVFVQSPSHTHGFTKAAIVKEKQSHTQQTGPYTRNRSVLYTGLKYLLYIVLLSEAETCCHLLRLWGFLFKDQSTVPVFIQIVCWKPIMQVFKLFCGWFHLYCVKAAALSEPVSQEAGALLRDISIFQKKTSLCLLEVLVHFWK